jgi:hypothetical protein
MNRCTALFASLAMTALMALSHPAQADEHGSYQTCSLPASRIAAQGGQERAADPAYAKVCVAVLPPDCRNWTQNKQPCAYRKCVVRPDLSRCPDGEIPAYVAKEVIPFTKEQFAAMNAQLDAPAKQIVNQWGGNAPPAGAGQQANTDINRHWVETGNGDVTYQRC